jgi:hypothetical protein
MEGSYIGYYGFHIIYVGRQVTCPSLEKHAYSLVATRRVGCVVPAIKLPTGDRSMTMGYFTNHTHQPSPEEIRLALGSIYPLWERLTRFIDTNYQTTGEWSTWGPANFGWGLRYRKKEKALVALYPQKEMIIAQVVQGKAQAERALSLKLGEKVSQMLREAPQLRDGRWLSIPILNEADVEDVEQLLLVKMQSIRRTE